MVQELCGLGCTGQDPGAKESHNVSTAKEIQLAGGEREVMQSGEGSCAAGTLGLALLAMAA